MSNETPNQSTIASLLLTMARNLRHVDNVSVLRFYLVSEIRQLLHYQQAILFKSNATGFKIEAISNVATLDRHAPYVVFLERIMAQFNKQRGLTKAKLLNTDHLTKSDHSQWDEYLCANALWQPLYAANGDVFAGLLLVRTEPWCEPECVLLEEIADIAAHVWRALEPPPKKPSKYSLLKTRNAVVLITMISIAILCMPVRLSVIAPAEVIPKNPSIIAAPINGVIKKIHVQPNADTRENDVLFSYEDAQLRANYDIALRAVDEVQAQLHRASQQAFKDPKGRAEVALLQARLALRKEQANYSAYQLSQVDVKTSIEGVAIFNDANQWRGRPVSVGERVMAVATSTSAQLAIYIPVTDAIELKPNTAIKLFLDVQPLHSINAHLVLAAYQPETTPEGVLSYRAVADFADEDSLPRIGLKGSAKVLGDRVPLVLFLFRRPLVALRQMVGF